MGIEERMESAGYTGVLLTLEVESSGIINIEGCNQLKKELHIARHDFFDPVQAVVLVKTRV